MFGTDNSIEPVRAVAAVAVTANGRSATQIFVEPPIREATPGDLASAARRARTSAAPEPTPVQAVAKTWGSFFRRRGPTEPDKPDAVAQRHGLYTAERRGTRHYYADYQQKQEVMRADPKRISTKLDDKQTISAMLDLAQSRGWSTVRLRGTADFQREAWVQAQVRGIAAEGYKPTATDQQEAARRKAAMAPVQAPSVQAVEFKATLGAAALRDTAKVRNSVAVAASAEKGEVAPAKAAVTLQPKPTVAMRRTATAAPAQATAATATPAGVQASPAAAKNGAVANKGKATAAERSKAVWGAVEATGKQARAADSPAAKVTAGERPAAATTA